MAVPNRYAAIIERIFHSKFKRGLTQIEFEREEMERFAKELGIAPPKNLGDLVYSFRYRTALPESIRAEAGEGRVWIIKPAGRSKYKFVLASDAPFVPNQNLVITKVPDATPGIVARYALSDEQALLAKLRYNRLVDIFTGVACYSLQNHLRTSIPEMGQVETDELYVGIDKKGSHYVFPVQAKGGRDKLHVVQIEQDIALCALKFPGLACRPIGAQFMEDEVIALFEFRQGGDDIRIAGEKHYRLVPPDQITESDLAEYARPIPE
jgi:hypothetical protein